MTQTPQELAESIKRLREFPEFEEIRPCPYVNAYASDNSDVNYMVKPYEYYTDIVLFSEGKPNRCLRIGRNTKAINSLVQLVGEMETKLQVVVAYADDGAAISARRCVDEALTKAKPIAELAKDGK